MIALAAFTVSILVLVAVVAFQVIEGRGPVIQPVHPLSLAVFCGASFGAFVSAGILGWLGQ